MNPGSGQSAFRRVPLSTTPERRAPCAWDDSKPALPQVWGMDDGQYHSFISTFKTSGPSVVIVGGPLERFTHSALWQPLVTWVPLSLYLLFWSHDTNLFLSLLLFGVGWLYWTLLEYVLHRWVFHLDHWWGAWPRALLGARNVAHFLFHGIHHKYPSDRSRVITPLVMTGGIALPVYLTLLMVFPRWVADPFVAGAFAGYLFYDYTHYAYHVNPVPKWLSNSLWFRFMKRRHNAHHFKDEHAGFGVSVGFTDTLFGTQATKPHHDL